MSELDAIGRSLEPSGTDSGNTLGALLHRKACAGVQIRILLFRELSVSLPNNSEHAANAVLTHSNIVVLRHPVMPTLWSHHEKLLIIDDQLAYIGGIDLAFGRFDTRKHPLKDKHGRFVIGKELYNPRIAGFDRLDEPEGSCNVCSYQPL